EEDERNIEKAHKLTAEATLALSLLRGEDTQHWQALDVCESKGATLDDRTWQNLAGIPHPISIGFFIPKHLRVEYARWFGEGRMRPSDFVAFANKNP
ncbi:hypothetical protein, partial [Escherichia coli]|uniref:hypothetical protein n=1 Tax=Escherichia coli TaxID=562 RepID=UPI001412B793